MLLQTGSVLLLVFGFGFVIFWHELGHFIAAKWVGIKVEQFAVGFGQALFSWRKGVGVRLGNTQKEYQQKLDEYIARKYADDSQIKDKSSEAYQRALIEAEKEQGLGETEYRLNWIPLGGYVKMLGQDDLRPNSEAADPRSYNRKSIGARMVVVSAGVIMNVILAGIGFMVLFLMGFNVPPAWIGAIASNSPAQNTTTAGGERKPLQVGEQILDFNGKPQEDFTKIGLNVALSAQGQAQPIKVKHVEGTVEQLFITPRPDDNAGGFLSIGIAAPHKLMGLDPKDDIKVQSDWAKKALEEEHAVLPGDTITAIDGEPVEDTQYWKLDRALQNPDGKPVQLTIKAADGKTKSFALTPHFESEFGKEPLNFGGMEPRPAVAAITDDSSALGKVLPGDVIVSLIFAGGDSVGNLDTTQLRDRLSKAGASGQKVSLVVLRDGKQVRLDGLSPNLKVDRDKGRYGLGIGLKYDDLNPVVADVIKGSPAEMAHLKDGDRLIAINGKPVATWFDVQRELGSAKAEEPVTIDYVNEAGNKSTKLALSSDQVFQVAHLRRTHFLILRDYIVPRKTSSVAKAAYWGVTETRDFILQFYLTLRRMASGSVSPSQLMGPVGIFVGGAKFAFKGPDWLLWFLAMISANLAVVNFLPIPIVDGGLFTFLILEKIQGRPLSARAQAIAQYVGLAFLAGVFLFVTYHDIVRFIPFG